MLKPTPNSSNSTFLPQLQASGRVDGIVNAVMPRHKAAEHLRICCIDYRIHLQTRDIALPKNYTFARERDNTFYVQLLVQFGVLQSDIMDMAYPDCPIRNILAHIADKWSMLVLYTLSKQDKPIRFKELHREIPDISQKMLTTTLRTLEQDGFVSRKIYAEVPPRVEYEATARTTSLMPHLNSLFGWAIENMPAIVADREKALSR